MPEDLQQATVDPYALRDERIRQGRERILDAFRGKIAGDERGVVLAPDLADALRACLLSSGLYFAKERGVVTESGAPHKPPHGGSMGVSIPYDTVCALADALALPNIVAASHGSCDTCAHGPDRGWGWPCVGCGSYHPCHTPKSAL